METRFCRLLVSYETDSKYYQKDFCPCPILSVLLIFGVGIEIENKYFGRN